MKRSSETVTVAEVRELVSARLKTQQPIKCPCCRQRVAVRNGRLNANMARQLIVMYREDPRGEHRASDLWQDKADRGGDYAKLVHWGLIVRTRIGHYRMTKDGRRFVLGKKKVPARALTFNGKCYGLVGEDVDVFDVLGTEFDYQSLRRG